MDSSGINILIAAHHTLTKTGGRLRLAGASTTVMRTSCRERGRSPGRTAHARHRSYRLTLPRQRSRTTAAAPSSGRPWHTCSRPARQEGRAGRTAPTPARPATSRGAGHRKNSLCSLPGCRLLIEPRLRGCAFYPRCCGTGSGRAPLVIVLACVPRRKIRTA
ncbi:MULTISPECIES: STAS domain-containing protein [unclassified Streptomyces]|uniref:STAS domain-containing protein n=1 Tax=unclassified Streptomyces TaxID=2593676 RepID=UPI0035DE69FC